MIWHKHLHRLESVWINQPVFFITTCTFERRPLLACAEIFSIIEDEFCSAPKRHGWHIGYFVVMPDHIHFFCACDGDETSASLSGFIGAFKEWSSKRITSQLKIKPPIWQAEFFDHLLRSDECYADKWLYVRENPVRAGLVQTASDWPYAGEIEVLR
jgi:REP element-mobilizing transposase RayT